MANRVRWVDEAITVSTVVSTDTLLTGGPLAPQQALTTGIFTDETLVRDTLE